MSWLEILDAHLTTTKYRLILLILLQQIFFICVRKYFLKIEIIKNLGTTGRPLHLNCTHQLKDNDNHRQAKYSSFRTLNLFKLVAVFKEADSLS